MNRIVSLAFALVFAVLNGMASAASPEEADLVIKMGVDTRIPAVARYMRPKSPANPGGSEVAIFHVSKHRTYMVEMGNDFGRITIIDYKKLASQHSDWNQVLIDSKPDGSVDQAWDTNPKRTFVRDSIVGRQYHEYWQGRYDAAVAELLAYCRRTAEGLGQPGAPC